MPEPDLIIPIHPAADLIPQMPKGRFEALRDDIALRGLLVPIQLLDGAILDGRQRYRACQDVRGGRAEDGSAGTLARAARCGHAR